MRVCASQGRPPAPAPAPGHAPTLTPPHAPRRRALLLGTAAGVLTTVAAPAQAVGFKKELKKRRLTPADYTGDVDGLPSLDLAPSTQRGAPAALGDRVTVHWDSLYRGIDVASSRAARLLGGNRTVAEPLDFTVGGPVTALARAAVAESSGGLFSGMGGPQPPPALSTAVLGMRAGDKRALLIPPERGYGDRGLGEMPGGATFELRVEVLAVEPGGKE